MACAAWSPSVSVVLILPALAAPVTAGVAVGVANSETNADEEGD